MFDFIYKTNEMITDYLEANGKTIDDLIKASNKSKTTIYRFLAGEGKLTYDIAEAVHKLIPEISVEFLMTAELKNNLKLKEIEERNNVINPKSYIDYFSLNKFFPEMKNDINGLLTLGKEIFGEENFLNKKISPSFYNAFAFSEADNADLITRDAWVEVALYKFNKEVKEKLIFDKAKFETEFENIKKRCGSTDLNTTIAIFKRFCKITGINFYFMESVPNSRVKAVSFKKDGSIYLFISDLFKNIENLWISFVHELIHIKESNFEFSNAINDYNRVEMEKFIDHKVIEFFTSGETFTKDDCNCTFIVDKAAELKIPAGILTEIIRFETSTYSNKEINLFLHYFKSESLIKALTI